MIDHTLLKPDATSEEIVELCKQAHHQRFAAVCVNGCRAQLAMHTLQSLASPQSSATKVTLLPCSSLLSERAHTSLQVAVVIGFPLGSMTIEAKRLETRELINMGVDEIDMVINQGALKDKNYAYVFEDIKAVVDEANK